MKSCMNFIFPAAASAAAVIIIIRITILYLYIKSSMPYEREWNKEVKCCGKRDQRVYLYDFEMPLEKGATEYHPIWPMTV